MSAPEEEAAGPRPQRAADRPHPHPNPHPHPLCSGLFGVRGQVAVTKSAKDPHPPVEEPRSGLWL
jgi:hypothetical protein